MSSLPFLDGNQRERSSLLSLVARIRQCIHSRVAHGSFENLGGFVRNVNPGDFKVLPLHLVRAMAAVPRLEFWQAKTSRTTVFTPVVDHYHLVDRCTFRHHSNAFSLCLRFHSHFAQQSTLSHLAGIS